MERNITMGMGQGFVFAALLSCMTACEQTVQYPEAGPAPANGGTEASQDANETRTLTPVPVLDESLKALLNSWLKTPAGSFAPQGTALEKSAAQTCLIDFNNVTSLSAMEDHAHALYAVYPWYQQTCGAHTAMVSPSQGTQYYLVPTESNVCTGTKPKMGYGPSFASCFNQKDAALFPRKAGILTSTDANVGLAINDISAGYYRNFTFKSMNIDQGPVYVYGFKNPGGTWVTWGPLGAGFWNFLSGEGLGQLIIKSSNGSGMFLVDNITIVAN